MLNQSFDIIHGMKNMFSMGLLECGNDHRSIKDASYTVTGPGTVFYSVRRSHIGVDEDFALLTGEGLQMFRWNVGRWPLALKIKVN